MKVPIYRDLVVLQLALLVFLLDQFTKFLVRELLPLRFSFPYDGFFRITHTYNTGSAFGIFQGQNTPLIFVSFVGIVILALIYRSQARPSNLLRFSLALQLGGAFGNLVDRLWLGHVTDFIDIGPWPVFNLADASIVSGLVILAWVFLRPGQAEAPGTGTAPVAIDGYSWCPVCEGEMVSLPNGWRCGVCGVKEKIDLSLAPISEAAAPGWGVSTGDGAKQPPAPGPAWSGPLPTSPESAPDESSPSETRSDPAEDGSERGVGPATSPGREGELT